MGHLGVALLGPQFGGVVLLWSWRLEPRLIQRAALHGRDVGAPQTAVLLDPALLLVIILCRAGGVIGAPDIALAQQLEGSGTGCQVRLGFVTVTITRVLLSLPGGRLTGQAGRLTGETKKVHL